MHQHTTACLTTQHKPNCCTPTAKVLAPCLGHPMHGSAHIIVIITFCAYPRSPKPSHDMPAVSLCKKHGICLRIGQPTTRPTRSMYQPTFRPGRLKPKKTTMLCSNIKRCCQPPRTITLLISFPGGTAHHGQQPQLVLPVQEGSAPTAHSPDDTCCATKAVSRHNQTAHFDQPASGGATCESSTGAILMSGAANELYNGGSARRDAPMSSRHCM